MPETNKSKATTPPIFSISSWIFFYKKNVSEKFTYKPWTTQIIKKVIWIKNMIYCKYSINSTSSNKSKLSFYRRILHGIIHRVHPNITEIFCFRDKPVQRKHGHL